MNQITKADFEDILDATLQWDVDNSIPAQACFDLAIRMRDEFAINFAEWLELEGYRIKGLDDGSRRNLIWLYLQSLTK